MLRKIRNEYSLCFRFMAENKRLLIATVIGFFFALFASAAVVRAILAANPEAGEAVLQYILEMFEGKDIVSEEGALSAVGLFKNNIFATYLSVIIGVIPFLFLPAWTLIFNAFIIGAMWGIMTAEGLATTMDIILLIVPHGIFELPAMIIGAFCGVLICIKLTSAILKPRMGVFGGIFFEALRTMVLVMLPLLAVAAVVEAYVTPLIYLHFNGLGV